MVEEEERSSKASFVTSAFRRDFSSSGRTHTRHPHSDALQQQQHSKWTAVGAVGRAAIGRVTRPPQ